MGLLGLGVRVVLVEPHLPLHQIQTTVQSVIPRAFIAGIPGKIWGARIPAIREIPHWTSTATIFNNSRSALFSKLQAFQVPDSHPGIITFTSGTSLGHAKGVVRTHGILFSQTSIIDRFISQNQNLPVRPDLTVFPNLVLANLARGQGSVLVRPDWRLNLKQIEAALPSTLSAGPGFLRSLLDTGMSLSSFQSIHIGGASTDLKLLQKLIERAPQARILQVYGSTEAEPVAISDAADVILRSKERGYFQSSYIGAPISEIQTHDFQDQDLWIAGPHVCRHYIGNDDENRRSKRKREDGILFHRMGDRVEKNKDHWWYQGRITQELAHFELEQKLYVESQSSRSFLHATKNGLWWVGEAVEEAYKKLPANVACEIVRAVNFPIVLDKRHRARIDRTQTIKNLLQKESVHEFKDQPALPYL
jgi:acyl-CoA synthetase (AMP-forming)/AMP-acid ligase II